jgi:dynein heavy chain
MRIDRTLLVAKDFIKNNDAMGDRYTEPVTDTMEMIYGDMTAFVPVIFLLSAGADPTDNIEQLAKKKKQSVQCVSLGQGQVRWLPAVCCRAVSVVQCHVAQCRFVSLPHSLTWTCVVVLYSQEPVAMKAINAAAVNGTWVLLQNCELGLPLMDQMEDVLLGMRETVNPEFRLFITCLSYPISKKLPQDRARGVDVGVVGALIWA